MKTNFGQIKREQTFFYKGKIWKRIHGIFALPVNQIGTGQAGWPFSVKEMVEKTN